jgi:hypothetical protein
LATGKIPYIHKIFLGERKPAFLVGKDSEGLEAKKYEKRI